MICLWRFIKNGSQLRTNRLCLSNHSVRRDRSRRKYSNSRSLSGSCLGLWNPSQPRQIPDFLHGMGVSTFPTPGQQFHGASLSPHSHRKWGELWKSRGHTLNPCSHSIPKQNPEKCCNNLLMQQRGWEALSTNCAAPGGARLALRAWPGHFRDLLII